MEFRRAEIKKVYRHIERIAKPEDVRMVFESLKKHNLVFSMRIRGIGSVRERCAVVSVRDDSMDIISRSPSKCWHRDLEYDDVELVEVICNKQFITEENDSGGRWSRIITEEH